VPRLALRSTVPPSRSELEERSRVLGVLFLTGAVLVASGLPLGLYDEGRPDLLGPLLLLPASVGLVAVLLRRRLAAWTHGPAVAGGSAVIAVVVLLAGPEGSGVAAIFLLYVSCFSYYYLTAAAATLQWAFGAAAHAASLGVAGYDGAVGQWVTVNGAALVAGGLLGSLGGRSRLAAAEQRRLRARLEVVDEAKTTFLRAVGHELRGPLATTQGFATTLRDRGDELDPADRRQLLAGLADGTERLQRALDDLLRFGDMTEGIISLELREVDLRDIVERAVAESGLERERVALPTTSVTVEGDEGKLVRAVANLLGNAAKYTPPGTPVTVSVEADPDAAVVRIAVEDRGPGVPEEDRERVFAPFVRIHVGAPVPGTGIGLSLVHQIARLHAGSCHVEDVPGGGARFCIVLPERRGDGPGAAEGGAKAGGK
jgi:signal transduction histidine kinase